VKVILFIVFFGSTGGGSSQSIEFESMKQCEAVRSEAQSMQSMGVVRSLWVYTKCVEVPNEA
jgi:hypothetical protein